MTPAAWHSGSYYRHNQHQQNNAQISSRLNFESDFSLILTRENVQNLKPHPEVYLKAARHFQLQPEECLIIEDSVIGVEAGIEVVAIYDPYSAHELEKIKAKADYFVQGDAELL